MSRDVTSTLIFNIICKYWQVYGEGHMQMYCGDIMQCIHVVLRCIILLLFLLYLVTAFCVLYVYLQCFDTVGWAAGRASGL